MSRSKEWMRLRLGEWRRGGRLVIMPLELLWDAEEGEVDSVMDGSSGISEDWELLMLNVPRK